MMRVLMVASAAALVAGCGTPTTTDNGVATGNETVVANDEVVLNDSAAANASAGTSASADLQTADGKAAGHATAEETAEGIRIVFDGTGLPKGTHGLHVHTTGKCDGPEFTTAGGHWNPTMHQHGSLNPQGPHVGDLPNLEVAADGTAHLEGTLAGGTIAGLLDADGSSIVVHAGPDDLKSDPAGNSGARIACGVFKAS